MDCFERLESFELIEPGPNAKAALIRNSGSRYMAKDQLVLRDGLCAWCEKNEVTDKRRKYCSNDCSMSSDVNCYPQAPQTKAWRLIKIQGCACAGCGTSFEDEIREKLVARVAEKKALSEVEWFGESVWVKESTPISFHFMGCNSGEKLQVDHIVPIHKGGAGVGLDNTQVLCRDCHLKKTAKEAGE
jgi:hypothetical protein